MSKKKGQDNNLLELIAADPAFNLTLDELKAVHASVPLHRPLPRSR